MAQSFGQGTQLIVTMGTGSAVFPAVVSIGTIKISLTEEDITTLTDSTAVKAVGGLPKIEPLKLELNYDEDNTMQTLVHDSIAQVSGGLAPQYPMKLARSGSIHGHGFTGSFSSWEPSKIETQKFNKVNVTVTVVSGYTKY